MGGEKKNGGGKKKGGGVLVWCQTRFLFGAEEEPPLPPPLFLLPPPTGPPWRGGGFLFKPNKNPPHPFPIGPVSNCGGVQAYFSIEVNFDPSCMALHTQTSRIATTLKVMQGFVHHQWY